MMPVLDLPKTKLALHADEMLKYGPGDVVVARYPTDQIIKIGLEKSKDLGFPCVVTAVFGALAFVSYRFISSPGWSWAAVIVCLGVCGIVMMSIDGRKIVVETTNGTVRYVVAELFEEAEGFVLSANSLLELERPIEVDDQAKQLVEAESQSP